MKDMEYFTFSLSIIQAAKGKLCKSHCGIYSLMVVYPQGVSSPPMPRNRKLTCNNQGLFFVM